MNKIDEKQEISVNNKQKKNEKLKRGLEPRHLQLIAIGGTIGTMLFLGSAKAIVTTGPSILLVYTLAGVIMFLFMRILGEMMLSNLEYKSFQDIVYTYLGKNFSFFIGWMYWIFWIIACVQDSIAVSAYFQFWFPNIPKYLPALSIIVLLILFNLTIVSVFGEIEFWLAIIKIITIIFFIVLGVFLIITGIESAKNYSITNLWQGKGGFFATGFNGMFASVYIAFVSFAGIELISVTSAETKHPKKTLPKAINSIPIRILLFYVGSIFVILCIEPWKYINTSISPFVSFFTQVGIPFAVSIIQIVLITAAVSGANSGIYSTSRMMFGLVANNNAPKQLKKLNKNRIPVNSIILSSSTIVFFVIVSSFYKKASDAFISGASWCTAMYLIIVIIILISYFKYAKTDLHKNSKFKSPFGVVGAVICLLFVVFTIFSMCLSPAGKIGLLQGILTLIVLFIATKTMSKKQKNK